MRAESFALAASLLTVVSLLAVGGATSAAVPSPTHEESPSPSRGADLGALRILPPPTIQVLAARSETTGGFGLSFPLNFTVPAEGQEVLYAWALGGNFSAYQPPKLPTDLAIRAFVGGEGVAAGNLSGGNYSTNLSYPGWTNFASIVVYGISGDPSLQFSAVSQLNQGSLSSFAINLTLPAGGVLYLGVEATGGTWPVDNTSLTSIDEQTPALRGGMTGLIGRQSNNTIRFTTIARGGGIVGVAIDANATTPSAPSVDLLASFSMTTGGYNLSFPLEFFVPAGIDQVLYLWALGGNYSAFSPPELPAGMTVMESLGFEGVAAGNLSAGSYASNLTYAGWTNTVSIAVYGVSAPGLSLEYGSRNATNREHGATEISLALPSGAGEYLGVESTGGTWPVLGPSLSSIDEYAWALRGGHTGDIGRQATSALFFSSNASTLGIVGVGIFSNASSADLPLTFQATGLPDGAAWQLSVGGLTTSTRATQLTFAEAKGPVPYVIVGPAGFRVAGMAPTGTLVDPGAPMTETVSFVRGHTADLRFRESGLAAGARWCVVLDGLERCSGARSLSIDDLTPASYSYEVVPIPLTEVSVKAAHRALPARGELEVGRSMSVALRFVVQSAVTFVESGLTPGTSWSVTIGGQTLTSTNATLVTSLSAGTYRYQVGPVPGYTHVRSARLKVPDRPVTVEVLYTSGHNA